MTNIAGLYVINPLDCISSLLGYNSQNTRSDEGGGNSYLGSIVSIGAILAIAKGAFSLYRWYNQPLELSSHKATPFGTQKLPNSIPPYSSTPYRYPPNTSSQSNSRSFPSNSSSPQKFPQTSNSFHASSPYRHSWEIDEKSSSNSNSLLNKCSPEIAFSSEVLNWDFEKIRNPLNFPFNRRPIPGTFSSRSEYYEVFLPWILEEARISLEKGIEANPQVIPLQLVNLPKEKNLKLIRLEFTHNNLTDLLIPGEAILLCSTHHSKSLKFFGMISQSSSQIIGVTVRREKISLPLDQTLNSKWNAYPLGSLVTYSRMYEACVLKTLLRWDNQLLQRYSDRNQEEKKTGYFPSFEIDSLNGINRSQQIAIEKFTTLREGIQIVEGPPGTGKTTMIVNLLKKLSSQGRVLVCAPSNKAIQVIASRFHTTYPKTAIILAGVMDKLKEADHIHQIFLHSWKSIKQKKIELIRKEFSLWMSTEKVANSFRSLLEDLEPYGFHPDAWGNSIRSSSSKPNFESLLTQVDSFVKTITELDLLNSSRIIFSTLSVSGRRIFKRMDPIHSLVIDEAAQAMEPETLIPFHAQPDKCLLVGDINQLCPTVFSKDKENLERSMMERLIRNCKFPFSRLNVQYRMDPEIRSWPSYQYYENTLTDGKCIFERKPLLKNVAKIFGPCSWIHVYGTEKHISQSIQNEHEAETILKIISYLHKNLGINVTKQVGVISFYSRQIQLITQKLQPHYPGVRVKTVDSFQGDENEIIILSFVRSNPQGNIGFLNDSRRLNVAITRAKRSLIMVGNGDTMLKSHLEPATLVANLKQRKLYFSKSDLENSLMPQKGSKNSR